MSAFSLKSQPTCTPVIRRSQRNKRNASEMLNETSDPLVTPRRVKNHKTVEDEMKDKDRRIEELQDQLKYSAMLETVLKATFQELDTSLKGAAEEHRNHEEDDESFSDNCSFLSTLRLQVLVSGVQTALKTGRAGLRIVQLQRDGKADAPPLRNPEDCYFVDMSF